MNSSNDREMFTYAIERIKEYAVDAEQSKAVNDEDKAYKSGMCVAFAEMLGVIKNTIETFDGSPDEYGMDINTDDLSKLYKTK